MIKGVHIEARGETCFYVPQEALFRGTRVSLGPVDKLYDEESREQATSGARNKCPLGGTTLGDCTLVINVPEQTMEGLEDTSKSGITVACNHAYCPIDRGFPPGGGPSQDREPLAPIPPQGPVTAEAPLETT